jgi:ribosome biogenesis GTPase A
LVESLIDEAKEHGKTIHVMGAANVGKSSFLNRILQPSDSMAEDLVKAGATGLAKNRRRPGKKVVSTVPAITVSNLPGTTLDFLKIKLSNEITMIDTPGLINPGHLTSKLTTTELKEIIPAKPINAITLRLEEGKCVLIGGLASIEFTQVSSAWFHINCLFDLFVDPLISSLIRESRFSLLSLFQMKSNCTPLISQKLRVSWKSILES